MRTWSAKRGGWWFAAASVVLHVAWFALLREPPDVARERRSSIIELSLETVRAPEPAQLSPSPHEPSPPPAPARTPPLEWRRERVHPAEKTESRTPAPVESSPPATVAEVQPIAPPSAAAPQPSALDLSPRRAASTMIDQLEVARVCRPSPGAASAAACEPPPDGVAAGQRALNETLRAAANEPEYRTRREPPKLHREGDGSYRYDGHVFSARIRPDGQVDFMDGPDVGVTGLATSFPGVRGGFDLSDAVEHGILAKERYSAEKRWFLEQTTSLRDRLADAARADEAARARRALSVALDRIVAARELTPEQKRARVLELWEDCGEDGEAQVRRRSIEAFVRERMAERSALGFSREELDRFNRGRRGMTVFEPYRRG